jgi:pyruvate formate lyase activating enzyme
MNIDLKSFNEKTYLKYCGAKLKPVLETIKRAYSNKIHLEITTLLIPHVNDSSSELKKIARFIFSIDKEGKIPWHISRFFPRYKFADGSHEITSIEKLKQAEQIGRKAGLKYVYLGNV